MQLVRIKSATPIGGFHVSVDFTDGTSREIDLEPFLRGKVFDEIRRDPIVFGKLMVNKRAGTIVWENGADIDPDVLYHNLKPAWAEESELELAK